MARFVVCALPGSGQVYINLDRATFVRQQDGETSLIGFDDDIAKGITVAGSAADVLRGEATDDPA